MKVVKITGFSLGGIALVLYVSPYFFKDQINEGIKSVAENYVKTEIEFKDLEGYLTINIVGNGTGNFASQIICNDRPGIYSTELTFELGFDQTFIKEMVYNLNEITKSFPIVGDYNKNNYNI